MSKRCQKENKNKNNENSAKNEVNFTLNEQRSMLCSVIGSSNVNRWNQLKDSLSCSTDVEFVKLLLDIAQKHTNRNKLKPSTNEIKTDDVEDVEDKQIEEIVPVSNIKRIHKHKIRKAKINTKSIAINEPAQTINRETTICDTEIIPLTIEPIVAEEKPQLLIPKPEPIQHSLMVNISNDLLVPLELHTKLKIPIFKKENSPDIIITPILKKIKPEQTEKEKPKKSKSESTEKKHKKHEHDVRKAPELTIQNDHGPVEMYIKPIETTENQRVAIKIKLCSNCGMRHLQDHCPIQTPRCELLDALSHTEWIEKYNENYLNEKEHLEQKDIKSDHECVYINKYSYSYLSLPNELTFEETNTAHGLGVFVKNDLVEFTQFGPLIGKVVKEVDVSEDSTMRDLFEINNGSSHIYFNTENLDEANWMRFIRPASSRDLRNLLVTHRNNLLYFITIRDVKVGEELLYWQDDSVANNKKKMEKTTCGGCNMTFLHPLYYRVHCSIFHDVRYSLTIRKYHCKVCGAAVLGKENIMKHATELHNGQGAYQCQFCKKFFLRLNYLEMHRTYGCSSNPHRSRPLCDFCGRKFCQPQKLKVHIKRMHSDMSEVLKEFQCKNCLKILGSRAALQRHLKEVHQKQVDGACACSKCGKLFQNKSNLKIHMLTHSGIKPFKCAENNCVAAFTTKQCLQFHYKKVHGFTEDMMPKIERSVDYTFEAYSGNDDMEGHEFQSKKMPHEFDNSDQEDNSLEDKNIDDPPALHSPIAIHPHDNSSNSNTSPPTLEAYASNVKILSKGSKKWIGEDINLKADLYPIESRKSESALEIEESETYDTKLNANLNTFRHESSNASLLVEAALDSVCSEPNIDIDVSSTPNCTDALVSNLYTLSHTDTLADVTYSHSVDVNDSRDINLMSPSVNDQISVTDDLNDELRHSQNIGIDYSSFHQEDFSPPNSPSRNNFVRDYINANSPQNAHNYENQKNISPTASPPRYDFGSAINQESDDSNGMGAQNLSLHKDGIQLDLSIYKSHYNFDNSSFLRKDFRSKFEDQDNQENIGSELMEKDFDNIQDGKHKESDLDLSMRANLPDIRNKFELDLDLRKSYDIESEIRRNTYEGSLDDFRIKNYDLDSLEIRNNLDRNKTYESLMDDFRTDRNFEPLVLNPSELQGLDMSARSYHNYSNLNRYHHLYSDVDRPSVDLRLNYSPPPPSYSHADILRVVSLDLTPPGRHSVDLTLRSHQIANSRLLSEHPLQSSSHRLSLDQSRLLGSDLSASRHLTADSRIISDMSSRILSDHTTNRILSNDQLSTNRLLSSDQRILPDDSRLLSEQPRLLDQSRLLGDGRILAPAPTSGTISPVPYSSYSVSPSPYHPTALPPRPHATSPNPASYHHYSTYY